MQNLNSEVHTQRCTNCMIHTIQSSRLQMLVLGWRCFHFVFLRNLLKLRCLIKVDFIKATFTHLGSRNSLILSCRREIVFFLPLLLFLQWLYYRCSRAISADLWTFFRPEQAKGSSAKRRIKQLWKNYIYTMKSITKLTKKKHPQTQIAEGWQAKRGRCAKCNFNRELALPFG